MVWVLSGCMIKVHDDRSGWGAGPKAVLQDGVGWLCFCSQIKQQSQMWSEYFRSAYQGPECWVPGGEKKTDSQSQILLPSLV